MASRSFELRELFHLTLLRHLTARLSGRGYALKGGICLRFFHRSPRLSEDMDLDVVSNVRVETLRNAVDGVVEGRALVAALMPAGITALEVTRPKQTETTQRWKVALTLAGGGSLPTKIEFSRRRDRMTASTGVPDSGLLRQYRIVPFAAQFYDGPAMAAQKIAALAAPARNALRDLFDLHHLLFQVGVNREALSGAVDAGLIEAASDKVARFGYDDFKEQVFPYLSADMMDSYRERSMFEEEKAEVERVLLELLG